MCYSFRSSIIAFSIAITTVFFMYMRQTKIDLYLMPFIFTYAFVQLAEALMWYDKQCGIINKIGGYMVYINLILHILSIGVGIYLVEKKKYGIFLGGLFALYFFITMPKIKCSKFKNSYCPTCVKKPVDSSSLRILLISWSNLAARTS